MKGSLKIHSRSTSVEHWNAVLRRLVQDGKAYPCFCTDEELMQMKAQAESESRPPIYTGRWAHASSEEVEQEKAKVCDCKGHSYAAWLHDVQQCLASSVFSQPT